MTPARHGVRFAAWLLLVAACLVPILALLVAPFAEHDRPLLSPHTPTAPTPTAAVVTTTSIPVATLPPSTSSSVHAAPGSLAEDNDQGDATFVPGEGGTWRTPSTFYCLRGHTADGSAVAPGIVAVSYANWATLRGTSWRVVTGPADIVGDTFTVHDKGPRAKFDMWTGDCSYARAYGRRTITVVPA